MAQHANTEPGLLRPADFIKMYVLLNTMCVFLYCFYFFFSNCIIKFSLKLVGFIALTTYQNKCLPRWYHHRDGR